MQRVSALLAALAALLILASCGGSTPEPTPTRSAQQALTPAPAPPTATPASPSAATTPPPPTAGPAQSGLATPQPAAGELPTPRPVPVQAGRLGAFFFYWYNCPQRECDPSQLSVIPPGWLTPLPRDGDERDGTAYSSFNYDWFEGELRDMASVGVEIVFPVSWGDHPHSWFRQDRLDLLVQANGVLERPLQIGMFLDSTAQQAMYNDFVADGYHFGPSVPPMPLSDPRSGYFFYDRHIKGFFERIPREMWATEQGRPLIVVYTATCCADLQLSGALWGAVKRAFARDFGVEPWLILEDTWFRPEAENPGGDRLSASEAADGRYTWGTALNGPSSRELRGFTASSIGPGFDNSRIPGIAEPRSRSRHSPPQGGREGDGAFLRASLAAVPPSTDLILLETWNEWPESTGIARATYTGMDDRRLPEDFYMEIVRRWRFGG